MGQQFDHLLWLWSLMVALGLLTSGLMGAALRGGWARVAWRVWVLATLAVAAVMAGEVLRTWHAVISPWQGQALLLGGLLLVLTAFAIFGRRLAQELCAPEGARRWPWLALLSLNALSAAMAAVYFDRAVTGEQTDLAAMSTQGGVDGFWGLVSAPGVKAVTDRGREVRLFSPAGDVRQSGGPSLLGPYVRHRVIELALADNHYNCHGWTFTGGRYLLVGADVKLILEDNGYSRVTSPSVGDVIVYRNEKGDVEHSGIVKFIDEQGQPLVESKWAVQGRFLHYPADYDGAVIEYYRTPRGNHLLRFENAPAGRAVVHADASLL